jgi:hypothetical protein
MFISIYVSRNELYLQLFAHFAFARVAGVKGGPGDGAGVGSVVGQVSLSGETSSFMDKAIG